MKQHKVCKVCNQNKAWEEYPKRNGYALKTCSECYTEQQADIWKKRYAEDPEFKHNQMEKMRRAQWKSRYGLTPEQVYTTLSEQGNKCANLACNTEISLDPFEQVLKRANIDHCHTTGEFRALLCNSCNTLLGRIEKDVSIIHGLIDYSNKFKGKFNT